MQHTSVSWEITLRYFFCWNYMIWTKGAHQSARFQTFDCSHKIAPNLYLDRLLLLKVYKNCVSLPWTLKQNLKKNWSVVSKMTRIWGILTQALESLKNLHFHWFLFCKVFSDLENDMRNMANFHQSTWKCQNWDLDGILLSKVENVWA